MKQLDYAKRLRKNMTDAERALWRHLRAHRLMGEKFRRQQPIGPYVVDFVHFGARLIVEADGGQHNQSASDAPRDAWLQAQGFRVLRFWNNDILRDTDAVLEAIFAVLAETCPLSPDPSPTKGKGSGESGPSPSKGEGNGESGPSPAKGGGENHEAPVRR